MYCKCTLYNFKLVERKKKNEENVIFEYIKKNGKRYENSHLQKFY